MRDCSISVVIPAYNVEKYVKAALDSIKRQTELPDEVILIDDGSSDSTRKIAETFYLPVTYKVISIENAGQGNARNLGAKLASSDYIHFFDSDDLLTENFIYSVKRKIRESQFPDIVLFSGKSFNDNEYQGDRWLDYGRGFDGVFSNRADFLDKASPHKALFCQPCMYVSKKGLWGRQGLEFGPDYLEDEALFYPLLFACTTFVVMNEVFFLRRNREGSTMTMVPNLRHVNGALNCIDTTMELYDRVDLSDKERWHVSKRLEQHCVSYIVMARASGFKFSYKRIIAAAGNTKNITILLKSVVYIFRLDQVEVVRKVGMMVRELRSKKVN